jgi:hypothetical protein
MILGYGRSVDVGAIVAIAAVGTVLLRLGISGRARTYAIACLLALATFALVIVLLTPQMSVGAPA